MENRKRSFWNIMHLYLLKKYLICPEEWHITSWIALRKKKKANLFVFKDMITTNEIQIVRIAYAIIAKTSTKERVFNETNQNLEIYFVLETYQQGYVNMFFFYFFIKYSFYFKSIFLWTNNSKFNSKDLYFDLFFLSSH